MPAFIDQIGQTIKLSVPPQRIISLVPSQTELLHALGMEKEVIGITKFCVHPRGWFRTKTRIGGTKNINLQKILSLQPQLVIANKEENVKEQVEELAAHVPVWVSDVNNLDDVYDLIQSLGEITVKKEVAAKLTSAIQTAFAKNAFGTSGLNTAYLIWKEPYMTVGGDTFIHQMLAAAGFQNIFRNKKRYPAVTVPDLQDAGCDLLLLSSEPYPFKQEHIDELQQHLPATKILLVDGEMFSWYGSRLLQAPAYFESLHQQISTAV
jgi:ABC-type Fe3+-hydroxamate transport system substrate-binding protein